MRLFLSYCKSHIYELHALLAAVITFFFIYAIKPPCKRRIAEWVEKKARKNEKWAENLSLYKKRANMLLVLLAIGMAHLDFFLISQISPLIHYSSITAFLCAVFTLDIYAVCEMIWGKKVK